MTVESPPAAAAALASPAPGGRAGGGTVLSIQYLRAAAALAVVVHHAGLRVDLPAAVGAAGVDVFFVISGFIMWTAGQSASGRSVSPLGFLRRRLVRIAPLYWAATLALAAAALLGLFPNLRVTDWHLALSLLFVPHARPDGQPYPLLVPGWTLNYEMFFYLVFALALALRPGARLAFLTASLAALVALGVALRAAGVVPVLPVVPAAEAPAVGLVTLASWTDPLLLQFLAGAWLGRAWAARALPGRGAGWAMVAAGAGAYLALGATGLYSDALRAALWGVPAVLVVAGALAVEGEAGGVRDRPLARVLGDASYSIYLSHTLLVSALSPLARVLDPLAFVAACVAASCALGVATFRLVERPATRLLQGWIGGGAAVRRRAAAGPSSP